MRLLASISSSFAVILLALIIPSSLAGYGPKHPQLRHEKRRTTEGRSFFGSLVPLFGKRDDCGTQYGPTYVDCGARGCYQPTLGQICCGSEGDYCDAGNYCSGLNCCPNGLPYTCCDTGTNCPANVSDYYTTASSTLPMTGTTSQPVAASTSTKASMSGPLTTKSATNTATGVGKSTLVGTATAGTSSSGTSSSHTSGTATASVVQSGTQGVKIWKGIEGVLVGVLGVVGFFCGFVLGRSRGES